jgi:hypothetical protein
MTDKFKIGDKVKVKYFRNEDDYRNQSKDTGWKYKTFLDKTSEIMNDIFIIEHISNGNIFVYVKNIMRAYLPFQIEKAYSLKDKLALIKELIK